MDLNFFTGELTRNQEIFKSLFENICEKMYLWKPAPDKWCLLEIICHLYDEEREDFRARVKHTLENPDLPLPPIDPVGWVMQRKYIKQDYNEVLEKFLKERAASIEWLENLEEPGWENTYKHPQLGELSAKMFLSNWIAHDYLHFRQITRTKYQYLANLTNEELSYAGKW